MNDGYGDTIIVIVGLPDAGRRDAQRARRHPTQHSAIPGPHFRPAAGPAVVDVKRSPRWTREKGEPSRFSTFGELSNQGPDLWQIQQLARRDNAHGLKSFAVKVSGSGVDGDDKIGVGRERAFQKTVVGLMPDDAQFGQGMANTTVLHNFGHEIRPVSQHVRVFLQHRGAGPGLSQTSTRQLKDQGRGVVLAGERGELQDAGVKNDFQDTV